MSRCGILGGRRPLFVWETDLLNELLLVVTRRSRVDREDGWSWSLSPDRAVLSEVGLFSSFKEFAG